jgi:hypothetical protein
MIQRMNPLYLKSIGWSLALLLFLPPLLQAQNETSADVFAHAETLRLELELACTKLGVEAVYHEEAVLGHLEAHQVYFRVRTVLRRVNEWGDYQGIDAVEIPRRPRGAITLSDVFAMATQALSHTRTINRSLGLTPVTDAAVNPGKLPPDVFNELGKSLDLTGDLITGGGVEGE